MKKRIIALLMAAALTASVLSGCVGSSGSETKEPESTTHSTAESTVESSEEFHTEASTEDGSLKSGTYELSNGMSLTFSDSVRNDVTGNWKLTRMADPSPIGDVATEYYEKMFSDDKEIHAVINFTLHTTTKIAKVGKLLNVTVYEYVDKEEHDANVLFTGMVLSDDFIELE